jgi:hypothetical protein
MKKAKRRRKRQEWRRHQIENLTGEIKKCLKAELWYAGLVLTLMLPDICAALEASDGQTSDERYRAWYEKWLQHKYKEIGPTDVYYLRCGIAHQAKFSHRKMKYDRIFFTLKHPKGKYWSFPKVHKHRKIQEKDRGESFSTDLKRFCDDVIDSVDEWYAHKKNDSNVISNVNHLVQFYPHGLLDYLDLPAIG